MQIDDRARKASDSPRGMGLLRRLRRDSRGNTLAIVGAALVPLAGMIGSGVDMSRAYMAKTRLQSACDAAALAGRRVMQNDTMTTAVENEATRFFNFNFRQGLYSTNTFTPAVTRPSSGTVRVTASTQIPTSIMRIFGFTSLPLNVTCDASLNFVNTDIMLVLDTTGSMLEDVNGNATSSTSSQKITALRDAVMALYDELAPIQAQLEANQMRLRYGVVPYSSTVNVGGLIRSVNPSYLADSVTFQSRVSNYTTQQTSSSANGPYWEYYTSASPYYTSNMAASTSISQSNCLKFMQNQAFTGFTATPTNPTSGGPAPTPTVVASFPHDGTASDGGTGEWGWTGAPDTNSTGGKSCRRRRTDTTTTYRYTYTNDTYLPATYDTSQFKLGNPVTLASNDGGSTPTSGSYSAQALASAATGESTTTSTWNGCIMERDTVATIAPNSGYSIPASAHDLNINMIPSSDATRWRPHWPDVTHHRSSWYSLTSSNSSSGTLSTDLASLQWVACPTAARRLAAWNRGNMESYVESLVPDGYTYHDIGMLWGARMISSGGIFADSPDTHNSMPVSRHIIFMTDGVLNTQPGVYGAYGVEGMEHRVGGTSTSDLTERHRQRFRMICNSAKSMNISIWVVAFASTLESSLVECASNSNQASTSANRDQLIERFRQIGSQIGALRLTQ